MMPDCRGCSVTAVAVVSKAERRHYWSHEMMNELAAVTQNHIVAISIRSITVLLRQRAGR
jgi:hypothetical protein